MKKTFLKAAAAAAVVAATVALSSVAVFASAQSYVFGDIPEMATFGYATGGEIIKGLSYEAGSAEWISDTSKGGPGVKLGGESSSSKGRMFAVKVDKGDVISAEFCGQSSSASGADCAITNSKENMKKNITAEDGAIAIASTNGYTHNTVELKAGAQGTYYIGAPNVKSMILSITVTPTTGTVYEDDFGTPTDDSTVTVPGEEVSSHLYVSDITDKVSGSDLSIETDKTYGNFTIHGASGKITVTDSKFSLGGSKRAVSFSAEAGSVVKVSGIMAGSATDVRTLLITKDKVGGVTVGSIVSDAAKSQDLSVTISEQGTYYLYSDKSSINFTKIEIYPGVKVKAPTITLAEDSTHTVGSKVAYKGTISGDADDTLTVNTINITTARGYDAQGSSVPSKTTEIKKVAKDGNGYAFIVTLDTSVAEHGFKIQASVDYDCNGSKATSYSALLGYGELKDAE